MKQFWFYKDVFLWSMLLVAAVLVPRLALSADEPCESKASAILKKKSVDIEMAVIAGELSDLEVAGKKESILRQVRAEKESCRRNLASRAPVAQAQSGSL